MAPLDRPVPLHHLLWHVFRHRAVAGRTRTACFMLVHQMAQALEGAWRQEPERLVTSLEGLAAPKTCDQPASAIQRALRSRAAEYLNFVSFCKRAGGFWKGSDLVLSELAHESPTQKARAVVTAFVAAYFASAKVRIQQALSASCQLHCVGCSISFDATRLGKAEVLSLLMHVPGLAVAGPIQILPDSNASQPQEVLAAITDTLLARGKKGRTALYHASKVQLLALLHVLVELLPFGSLRPFIREVAAVATHTSQRLPAPATTSGSASSSSSGPAAAAAGHYLFDKARATTQWCLSPDLQAPWTPGLVHILSLTLDEGSPGWRVVQFLAHSGARVMYHPDPAHRLTNMYINSMKATPVVWRMVQAVLLVHKYRRAPFGGGKFWAQAVGSLTAMTSNGTSLHPVLEPFLSSIATELGVPVGLLMDEPHRLLAGMACPCGPKVELRRWWTHYDASAGLLPMWHLLLASLLGQYLAEGRNPMLPGTAARRPAPGKVLTEAEKNFRFKEEVLKTLWQSQFRHLLQSNNVTYKPLQLHFADYIAASTSPDARLKFIGFWSSPAEVAQTLLVPTLESSLFDSGTWAAIGLQNRVDPFSVPLDSSLPELNDTQELLVAHVRQCMEVVGRTQAFAALYQTPPWLLANLLLLPAGDARLAALLQGLRSMWQLVLDLELSRVASERALLRDLVFTSWHVFREPLLLLELQDWVAPCRKTMDYVAALFQAPLNSIGNENAFNDLRDCTKRSAKSDRRNPSTLAAYAIRSFTNRHPQLPTMKLTPAEVDRHAALHVEDGFFKVPALNKASVGLDPEAIRKTDWATTSAHLFSQKSTMLLQALLLAPKASWTGLWVNRCIRAHLVLQHVSSDERYYALWTCPYMCLALRLVAPAGERDPDVRLLGSTVASFCRLAVTSMGDYVVHPYRLQLDPGAGSPLLLRLGESMPLLRYMVLHYLHLVPAALLRDLCSDAGVDVARNANILALARALVEHLQLSEADAQRVLQPVQALYESRLRKRASKANQEGGDAEAEDEEPVDQGEGDAEPGLDPDLGAILHDLAPNEAAYMAGLLPGGCALTEEEMHEEEEEEEEPRAEAGAAADAQPAASDAQPAASSGLAPDTFRACLANEQGLAPHGCRFKLLAASAAQGPSWVGYLPAWRGLYQGKPSRGRSFQSGSWHGCGRSEAAAKAEVLKWLQDAMEGHTEPEQPAA